MTLDHRLPDDFTHRVEESDTGCWLWRGAISTTGYGRFRSRDKAHRFAYEQLVGPIPEGLELDHLCRVRACCNPDHLEAVTHQENVRRGLSPFMFGTWQRARTHCPQGHPYDDVNTFVTKDGKRVCRTCQLERGRRYALAERTDPARRESYERTLERQRANAKARYWAQKRAS